MKYSANWKNKLGSDRCVSFIVGSALSPHDSRICARIHMREIGVPENVMPVRVSQ